MAQVVTFGFPTRKCSVSERIPQAVQFSVRMDGLREYGEKTFNLSSSLSVLAKSLTYNVENLRVDSGSTGDDRSCFQGAGFALHIRNGSARFRDH